MRRYILAFVLLLGALSLQAQTSKEFKFNSFNRIKLEFPAKVLIQYSPDYSIRVVDSSQSKTVVLLFDELDKSQGQSSIELEKFTMSVHDSTLYISANEDMPTTRSLRVSIIITMPSIEKICVETAASITITGAFELDNLSLDLEGASSIKIVGEPEIKHLSVKDEGASYVRLQLDNPIDYADFDIEGASLINAIETPIRVVNAKIEGASMCKVYPLDEMNIKVEGMSYVLYKGNPKSTHVKSEGLSIVKHVD